MLFLLEKVRQKFEKEERSAMLKQEKNALKREDKSRAIKRTALIEVYKKEKNMKSILLKTSRVDEIRYLLNYKEK